MATSGQKQLSNIPAALSSFVGREREIAEVEGLLSTTRLLTLTGPGGCGKTRLALQVTSRLLANFEDGIWLTEFAPLADASLVPQAVATTLGIREQPGQPITETLANQLESRQLLLVFDNCEHLAAACAQLGETLLRACPNLRILATSREALNLTGETVWVVPPLSLPDPKPWRNPQSAQQALAAYDQSEALRLFVDRATAASPGFALSTDNGPWVAEICRRLDGMPLAIELAAARVRALSVREITERLEDRFHLLTAGSRTAPRRQQSLEATLDWSYSLLPATEQELLQRLSVFAGGWSLAAGESVCSGSGIEHEDVLDWLSRLVDKSLVQAERGDGETRYRLLETIRQYAQRRLAEAGDETQWRNRHLDYFVAWAEDSEPHLSGPDTMAWLRRVEKEHDNLRAGLAWALTREDKAFQSLKLASLSGPFWQEHGYISEGRKRLAAALAQPGAENPENAPARSRALRWAGLLAYFQSDYAATRAFYQASLALCQAMGAAGQSGLADALEGLAEVDIEEGHYAAARPRFEGALAIYRDLGRTSGVGNALTMLGWLAMRAGDDDEATTRFEEALAFCRALGDPGLIAQALAGRGELAIRQGQYPLAEKLLQESLDLWRKLGDVWGTAVSLGSLGWLALRQHDFGRMRALLGESLAIRLETGDMSGSAWCLEKLAEAAIVVGQSAAPVRRADDFQRAARVLGAAAALRARLNATMDGADRPAFERHIGALRATLGEDAFSTAWAEGGAMALEQAAEYALAEPETTVAGEPSSGSKSAQADFGGLTARERQVAALIAQGQSNRKIAQALVVSPKTVETYVTRILGKLGFNSRVQIATWAVEKGLAPPGKA